MLGFWPYFLLGFWPYFLLGFWPYFLLGFWPYFLLGFWPYFLLDHWPHLAAVSLDRTALLRSELCGCFLLTLTNKYSWYYGAYPFTNNPSDGQGHHVFDELHTRLDHTYPAGTKITVRRDATDLATSYTIDLADFALCRAQSTRPSGVRGDRER